ncbi:MAG: exopolysaccharide biosynthesis polyprenyl glycosylphosphotransferase [Acidobacteria bacterium]|nr:exopolysaccharide biosynthesis polyprenyl glycosylphosphotransferase [Acidobacteriota bacterium]
MPVLRVLVLVCADLLALALSVWWPWLVWPEHGVPLAQFALLAPGAYAVAGLYPGFGIGAVETLRRFSYATTAVCLAIGAGAAVLAPPIDLRHVTLALSWVTAVGLVPLGRFALLSMIVRWRGWQEPAVLLGSGPWITETVVALQSARSIGFRPDQIIECDDRSPIAMALTKVHDSIRTVIVADSAQVHELIAILHARFRRVILVHPHRSAPIEGTRPFNLGGLLGIEFRNSLARWQSRLVKRLLDLVLASMLALPAIPIIVLGALYVRWRSAGSPFFVQERDGYQGRPLRVWKLRTMYPDAEARLATLMQTNQALHDEWQEAAKLKQDPRIVPGCAFLRRHSLDELPQLWNILRGELSFVGPRPLPRYHTARFSPEFRHLRQRVRPGLTGLWQVMARGDGGLDQQEEHDGYYIRNWSLWMDLYIMARTVFVVISGRGAY